MDEKEQKEVENLIMEQKKLRENSYNYMKTLLLMDNETLKKCGYREGLGKALESVIRNNEERIEKLKKEYLRKYPD